MQLLLVGEQTALIPKITSRHKSTLQELRTEDGRVGITAVLTVTPPQPAPPQPPRSHHRNSAESLSTTLSLSLSCSVEPAKPILVHCKLVVSDRRCIQIKDRKPSQIKKAEVRAILQPGSTNVSTVSTLPFDHPFEKVIILFRVYDIVDALPASGVIQRLNKARLEGSSSCDVKLVVDGVELNAHRAVLAERSPVLNRMLTTGLFKEGREGRVEVVDFPRAAIEKFLEYLYTDRVEDCDGWDVELLQLADKYEVPELTTYLETVLWACDPLRALEVLNASDAVSSRVVHARPSLASRCFAAVVSLAAACLASHASKREARFHLLRENTTLISSQLRRRLTTIVMDNLRELDGTPEWAAFKKNHPDLVDIMLGSAETKLAAMACPWLPDQPDMRTLPAATTKPALPPVYAYHYYSDDDF